MNRRTFLARLFQAGAALGIAKHLPNLPVPEPVAPVVAPTPADPFALGLNKFRIDFPDGTRWSFDGLVSSQSINSSIDGVTEMSVQVQPTGPHQWDQRPVIQPRGTRARKTRGTTMQVMNDKGEVIDDFELMDITPPSMQRMEVDVTRNGMFGGEADEQEVMIPGLRRMGPVSFTVNYNPAHSEALMPAGFKS